MLIALAPALIAAVVRGGVTAAASLAAALSVAWGVQCFFLRRAAFHESALVTAAIFALTLPATAPWWLSALGAAIAVSLGKHLGGGAGNSLFNSAALARAVLMGLAPGLLFAPRWPAADGITAASPLAKEVDSVATPLLDLLLGQHPGSLAEAAPLAVLAGGLFLVAVRAIEGRVPLVYFATVSLFALFLPAGDRIAGHAPWLAHNALLHIASGGVLLTGFFMLTDPVTAPFTPRGRMLFAALAGAATMLARFYTPYPDAAVLAVLLANACVPAIDARTIPREALS
ncbi:MAG: RnfABCDGE type electron transport complex subunit D [Planctomycetota bacterium]